MQRLTTQQIVDLLAGLPGWTLDAERGAIHRDLKFSDFRQAFAFMTEVAPIADWMDHHPEWFNVYNRVSIVLTTHDVDGLSQRDIDLAREIDRIEGGYPRS